MENNVFEKFNAMVDLAGLHADIAAAESNTGDYVEVPHGDYEVKIVKLELGESKKELPMGKVWFEVVAGEYKGQKIFMNQTVHKGFMIHRMNEFLTSLESGIPVQFENFVQYGELFAQIFDAIDGKAEYQLCYGENKGFNIYTIVKRF